MSTLKTDYKNDILDETVNEERTYDIVDGEGNILYSDVILRETTVLSQTGDTFGGNDINDTNKHLTDETNDISFQFGIDQNGNYGYIKDGESSVTPFKTRHTETYKPTVRANNNDMGLYHTKRYVDTTAVPNANTTTYTATTRGASLDMGATNTHRYVNTNGVPNSNSGTYSVTSNGTKDMGETNNYRYVSVSVVNSNPVANCKSNTFNNATTGYVSGLTVGKKYLLIVCQFKWSGNSYPINIVSGATIIEGLTEMWHAIVTDAAYMWLATVTATATQIGVSIDSTAQNVNLTAIPLL